jgi:hypothetical protein
MLKSSLRPTANQFILASSTPRSRPETFLTFQLNPCGLLSDEKMGLFLMNTLGFLSNVRIAHVECLGHNISAWTNRKHSSYIVAPVVPMGTCLWRRYPVKATYTCLLKIWCLAANALLFLVSKSLPSNSSMHYSIIKRGWWMLRMHVKTWKEIPDLVLNAHNF